MDWRFAEFGDLTPFEVHDLLQARSAVFVVEQNCVFLDVDGVDPQCWHLLGRAQGNGPLLAYCRLVPPGVKYPEPSIGRVITSAAARRTGAGRELMAEAVGRAHGLWPGQALRIGAQMYLERFYEDGIMHIEMRREG
jgi:ElaA protein